MLIKKHEAGEAVSLQGQVPALVGVLIFLGQFVWVGLIAPGKNVSHRNPACGIRWESTALSPGFGMRTMKSCLWVPG